MVKIKKLVYTISGGFLAVVGAFVLRFEDIVLCTKIRQLSGFFQIVGSGLLVYALFEMFQRHMETNVNKERLAKIVYKPIQYLVFGTLILALFLLCLIQQEQLRWLFETAFGIVICTLISIDDQLEKWSGGES